MTSQTSAAERPRIESDAAWWNELAAATGWTLHGFTFRDHASFIVPNQHSLASISGQETKDIHNALDEARRDERQKVVEEFIDAWSADHDGNQCEYDHERFDALLATAGADEPDWMGRPIPAAATLSADATGAEGGDE